MLSLADVERYWFFDGIAMLKTIIESIEDNAPSIITDIRFCFSGTSIAA